MVITNRERVGKALDLLKPGPGPFIQREVHESRSIPQDGPCPLVLPRQLDQGRTVLDSTTTSRSSFQTRTKRSGAREAGCRMIDDHGRPGSRRAMIGFIHPAALGGVLVHFDAREEL